MSAEFCICSVITPDHTRLMSLNFRLVNLLNPSVTSQSWKIAYNKEVFVLPKEKVNKDDLDEGLQRFIEARTKREDHASALDVPAQSLLPGISLEETTHRALEEVSRLPNKKPLYYEFRVAKSLSSYHHAFALCQATSQADSRFLIIVDPDFFVVQRDWIKRVLDHMKRQGLAIFGAPWNPAWYQKPRGFPATHLMVVDREKLHFVGDQLLPDLIEGGSKYSSTFWRNRYEEWSRLHVLLSRQLLGHLRRAIEEDWRQRQTVGVSRDTGFELRRLCQERGLSFECLTPVFDPLVEPFNPRTVTPLQVSPIVQFLLPERRAYLPKDQSTYSRTGFKERGFPSFRGLHWEEFLWLDKPFAFHVRGEKRKASGRDFNYLRNGLRTILNKLGMPGIEDPTPALHDEAVLGLLKSPRGLPPS